MAIERYIYSGPSIDEPDLADLEEHLGVTLPSDYKAFLLRINGGRPLPDNAFGYTRRTSSLLNIFYSVKHERIGNTIAQNQLAMEGRVPADLLTIGEDMGGSLICMGIGEDNYGQIFFWILEEEADEGEPPTYDNVRRIADNFTHFLASFRHPDIEPSE